MIKLQTTQLMPLAVKRSQREVTFGSDLNSAQAYKDHLGLEHSGFKMCSDIAFNATNHDVLKNAVIKQNNTVNNLNKKTAKNINFRGLLSVEQGEKLLKELGKTKANKIANGKYWKKFWKQAKENQTVFDAMFALLITCGLRPAAIFAQSNDHNREKNKKAASHSIASGIIGYGFAVAIFNPIKDGLAKMAGNASKYMKDASENAPGYMKKMTNWASFDKKVLLANSTRLEALKVLINQGSQAFIAPLRSLITIAMIPLVDHYILNKVFKSNVPVTTKEELKNDPTYKFAYINFKNSPHAKKVFQNFSGVMK